MQQESLRILWKLIKRGIAEGVERGFQALLKPIFGHYITEWDEG